VDITLPSLHAGQQTIRDSDARFKTVVAGRRFGKTRYAVAEALAEALSGGRVWWVAPTYKQSKIAGKLIRGVLAPYPSLYDFRKSPHWAFSLNTGGEIELLTGDDPDNLRGDGLNLVICDEAAFLDKEVWTEALRPAVSDTLGDAIFISTPSPDTTAEDWFADRVEYGESEDFPEWKSWKFTSYDNPHLADSEIDAARRTMTEAAFRREYLAEIGADPEGALWDRDWFDRDRVTDTPDLERLVVPIDPQGGGPDAAGIVVVGKAGDEGYVLADHSIEDGGSDDWSDAAVSAYNTHSADAIVGETNYGGDMVESVLRAVDRNISYEEVRASRGKEVRAQPVASLYKQERIHHAGTFPALEDELATWTPEDDYSPGRLDAVVWGFTELFDLDSEVKRSHVSTASY